MSVSIMVVDDEPDVAELFRQRFRRETRQGTYVMYGNCGLDWNVIPAPLGRN